MKKLLITFSFFLFLASYANAQFGARAGVNLANLSFSSGEESISTSNLLGFQAGITYDYAINETLSFRPGLIFSMKGAKSKFDFFGVTSESKTMINYLEIPLDFSYAAGAVNINAGPYIGYGLSISGEQDGEKVELDFEEDGIKKIDFGINFGLSYDVNEMISVGAQYGLGIANLDDSDDEGDFSVKNKVIGIFAGYAF